MRLDIVRAWKNPLYRASLKSDDLSRLPAHPSGLVELTDLELKGASGIAGIVGTTAIDCTEFTFRRHRCCP
jgi:mersacidin/lichenicidin family type 2 lantibiotic